MRGEGVQRHCAGAHAYTPRVGCTGYKHVGETLEDLASLARRGLDSVMAEHDDRAALEEDGDEVYHDGFAHDDVTDSDADADEGVSAGL